MIEPYAPFWKQLNSPWEQFFIDMISQSLSGLIVVVAVILLAFLYKCAAWTFVGKKKSKKDYDYE